jgi:hypothetical protein
MASNVATKEHGASVSSSTCTDERHPASAILDGNDKSFWYTTGLFPQEVVIAFTKEVSPANLVVVSRHGQPCCFFFGAGELFCFACLCWPRLEQQQHTEAAVECFACMIVSSLTASCFPLRFLPCLLHVSLPLVFCSSPPVRRFTLFKCDKSEPKQWDEIWSSGEVDRNLDALQHSNKSVSLKVPIRFLKLRIDAGYEEFAAVYEVRVEGKIYGSGGGD